MCSNMQRRKYGEEYVIASTLCKYDFKNSDSFDLSWARV